MFIAKLGTALCAGALSVALLQAPAFAASSTTRMVLDNLSQNVDFLDRSSRFALTNAKTAALHSYAFSEAREQTLAANAIDDFVMANPDAVAVQTGRSVAGGRQQPAADMRLPLGDEDLNSLEGLTGADFDEQYKAKQLDALKQVETDYETYIAKGDDPQLLELANRELPKIRKRLIALSKV